MNANEKISAAIATTNDVSDLMDVAIVCLRNQKINALGVYVSPQRSKAELEIAKHKIDEALMLIKQAKWPTQDDYDQI